MDPLGTGFSSHVWSPETSLNLHRLRSSNAGGPHTSGDQFHRAILWAPQAADILWIYTSKIHGILIGHTYINLYVYYMNLYHAHSSYKFIMNYTLWVNICKSKCTSYNHKYHSLRENVERLFWPTWWSQRPWHHRDHICSQCISGWWLSPTPPTPLKNDGVSSSLGMMTFPIWMEK